jgi:hypothetical protein
MHKKIPSKKIVISILGMVFLLTNLHAVLADDYTSGSFTVRNPLFGNGGTSDASYTSFSVTGIVGQIAPGESTSGSFVAEGGFEYFDGYLPVSQNWRWYDDEGSETPTTDLALENVAPSDVANNNTIKLRLTLNDETGIAGTDTKIRLQFSEHSDFSEDVEDVVESWNCVGNSFWCYGDGTDLDNSDITTQVLSDSTATGTHNEAGTSTTSFDIPGGEQTEMEFTIKSDGPRVNTTYYFRAYNASTSEPILIGTGESYPSLATAGASLSFTISGLGSGTATEGITTDAATTPTSIPFGELLFDTETETAQRIQVTTNATEGYQLFVYERQGLLHYTGDQIDPVTGTNVAPATWAAGCSSVGCYGYHPGDDTLSGGSTRFSTDNTYAQFDGTAREVAYSPVPVDTETIDMVYKIEVTDQQIGGQYAGTISYIITPVF